MGLYMLTQIASEAVLVISIVTIVKVYRNLNRNRSLMNRQIQQDEALSDLRFNVLQEEGEGPSQFDRIPDLIYHPYK
jgi:hypothetical protein